MKLNKKGNKVVLDTKYRLIGLSGLAIQFGLPFWYVAYRYDIFTFENERYAITGWGMILLAGTLIAFQKKIKAFVAEYNAGLSRTAQRAKYGHTFLTIMLVLAISSIFINGFLWFFGMLTVANYASLVPYSVYDKQVIKRMDLQKALDDDSHDSDLAELKKLRKQQTRQANL
jgi:hypothetical protein